MEVRYHGDPVLLETKEFVRMAAVGQPDSSTIVRILDEAAALARSAAVFALVERQGDLLHCVAKDQPDAAFRLFVDGGRWFVAWVSADRYLSQSIEADLMWTGDDLEELIEEEIREQGYKGPPLVKLEHFRDPDKLFTFRSAIPGDAGAVTAETLVQCLIGYNAAFAELGDMKGGDEE